MFVFQVAGLFKLKATLFIIKRFTVDWSPFVEASEIENVRGASWLSPSAKKNLYSYIGGRELGVAEVAFGTGSA